MLLDVLDVMSHESTELIDFRSFYRNACF